MSKFKWGEKVVVVKLNNPPLMGGHLTARIIDYVGEILRIEKSENQWHNVLPKGIDIYFLRNPDEITVTAFTEDELMRYKEFQENILDLEYNSAVYNWLAE